MALGMLLPHTYREWPTVMHVKPVKTIFGKGFLAFLDLWISIPMKKHATQNQAVRTRFITFSQGDNQCIQVLLI
jgi:hypothetical protein